MDRMKGFVRRFPDFLESIVHSVRKTRYQISRRIPWTIGYSEYKYNFIGKLIDSDHLNIFQEGKLPDGYGYRLDERVVEYPWFFSRIEDSANRILDAGSALNHRKIINTKKIRGRDIYICTFSYEAHHLYDNHNKNKISPSYIYGDIRELCFRDNYFDAVCSISTIEHIGMDNTKLYTPDQTKKEYDKYSYLEAVKELSRVLRQGGILYLSIPFGKYENHGWFQVFDSEMVERILRTFKPRESRKTFFKYEDDQWNFSSEEKCADGYYFDIHKTRVYEHDYLAASRCVVCIEMKK